MNTVHNMSQHFAAFRREQLKQVDCIQQSQLSTEHLREDEAKPVTILLRS
jgi:hypothetical protein